MSEMLGPSLMMLAGQSPVLLVYLMGAILALVFWRRCPNPCLLTLVAASLLLVVAVAQTFLTTYLIRAQDDLGWEARKLSSMLSTIGLVGSVIRAIALSILFAAVFVGRRAGPDPALRPTGPAR